MEIEELTTKQMPDSDDLQVESLGQFVTATSISSLGSSEDECSPCTVAGWQPKNQRTTNSQFTVPLPAK